MAFFFWHFQKKVVYLHPQFHAGDVCTSSAWVADIFKRRLLTLCSDSMKLRNFQLYAGLSNGRCPTGYRLSSLCLSVSVHHLRIFTCAHAYLKLCSTHESIFIFGVGFALSVSYNGQCEGLIEWNDNSRTPRFFYIPTDELKPFFQ